MDELLSVEGLQKRFPGRRNILGRPRSWNHAVQDVSFTLGVGRTLAVVGESGAGKSTVGRMILRLIEPDAGTVRFRGEDVASLGREPLRRWRRHAQMIFQDPYNSLDPRMVIGDLVAEPLLMLDDMKRGDREHRVAELLDRVGLEPRFAMRYPYEFSGGQLQRIAIARALATNPELIVCDEPVAALDMSVRAQILNLLRDLQEERGISYLFISHDLSLVRIVADAVAVMSGGRIVEMGPTASIFDQPQDPYTCELLSSVPIPHPRIERTRRTRPHTVVEEIPPSS